MLVKDIILKACDFTENDELSKAINEGSQLPEELKNLQDKLVKCLNLVRNEIASEYMPIVKMEIVVCENGKFNINDFSSRLVDIISIKDKYGNNVKYNVIGDELISNEEKIFVWYNTLPDEIAFEGEFSSTIPERVYAYGVVKEFFFLQTLYEDAKVWDERFKNSLQVLERKKSETVIPQRRWI